MSPLFALLKEFNLNEREISIYQYLLSAGQKPASQIACKLDLQRSSCYLHLQKLIETGLLIQIIKNNLSLYSAVPVTSLLSKAKYKQQLLNRKISAAEKDLPMLDCSFDQMQHKSKAYFYSGKNGLLQILDNILYEKPQQLKAFISRSFNQFINRQAEDFPNRRVNCQIEALALHPFGQERGSWQSDQEKFRLTKTISPVFDLGLDVLIYNNKTTLISSREEFGVTIESDCVSQYHSHLFDFAWKFAKAV